MAWWESPNRLAQGTVVAGLLIMLDGWLRRRWLTDVPANPRFTIIDAVNRFRGRYEPIIGLGIVIASVLVLVGGVVYHAIA